MRVKHCLSRREHEALKALSDSGPARLVDIAKAINAKRNYARKLMLSLIYQGFVEQDPATRRYRATEAGAQELAAIADGRRPVGSVRLAQRFARRLGVSVRTIYRNTAIAEVAQAMLALYPDLASILCKKRAGIGHLLKLANNPEAKALAATLLARGAVKTIREAVQSSLVLCSLDR